MRKQNYIEGKEAQKKFEETMKDLFKAPKSSRHIPQKRKKKGKD